MKQKKQKKISIGITITVAALGYFVDIYDLVLFSIVRVSSLKSFGLEGGKLLEEGVFLLNMQMIGMLLGGIFWGVLGDKKGRLSVLFGSIFLYSLANICNGFVTSIGSYGLLRFLAGLGLAGELGAAITLVSEVMSKENRGYGTALVASVGVSGAVLAAVVGEHFSWQAAYIVGGLLGFALLFLRLGILESGLFEKAKKKSVRRGDLGILFQSSTRFWRYVYCVLIGVPIWYVIGILITFSPELAREIGVTGEVSAGTAIMMCYIGLIFGDLASGFGSQWLKSRKKTVYIFLSLTVLGVLCYSFLKGVRPQFFYGECLFLGVAIGYWAVFVTIAAEQFGTNMRSTVTTSVPNFVRGAVVPLTTAFQILKNYFTLLNSALLLGAVCLALATFAISRLSETHGKDLEYLED